MYRVAPGRDAAELALIDVALSTATPVLGICRGLQVLNVFRKGTLHRHLPDILHHTGHMPKVESYGRREARLAQGSRLARILGGGKAVVPCHHHQAVDQLGVGLIASALATDGTIEAIEATDHPFAIGVQWHAEASSDSRLFEAFAEAARTASTRTATGQARSRSTSRDLRFSATGHIRRPPSVRAVARPKELTRPRENPVMEARMRNPAMIVSGAMEAIHALQKAAQAGSVPASTLSLVHLRASQINGCGSCVDSGSASAKQEGETDQRLFSVATWWATPYFTDAERAALALTEAVTRLADQADPVPDDVWDEAATHYDEPALSALILWIATTNVFNRLNVSTRQVAGSWG